MKINGITVKIGLAFIITGLVFGIAMGIGFGINEEYFKDYVARGVATHPEVHDANSQGKIWRYAQRAHVHATGISAFSLALVAVMLLSPMTSKVVGIASIGLGFGNLYPMAWLAMFIMAPAIGRQSAHEHVITEAIVYISVAGLLVGLTFFIGGILGGAFRDNASGGGDRRESSVQRM